MNSRDYDKCDILSARGPFAKTAFRKQKEQGDGRWTQSQTATVFLWFSHLLLSPPPHIHGLFFIPRQQTGLSEISPNFIALQGCSDLRHLCWRRCCLIMRWRWGCVEQCESLEIQVFLDIVVEEPCAKCLICFDLENGGLWIIEARRACYLLAVVMG